MRASEFINEDKMSKRLNYPTRGLHTYADKQRFNSDYVMNRVMMAVAGANDKELGFAHKDSWVGKFKSSHPYTKEEEEMLKLVYQAVGAKWEDLNHGDDSSDELDSTNTQSPVKGFKGYPK